MNVELITKEDLREMESRLLTEIKKLVPMDGQGASKKWLKSNEVRKLLKISPGNKAGGKCYWTSFVNKGIILMAAH
jgi:hypothetical protein